jgi:hypothetical protein
MEAIHRRINAPLAHGLRLQPEGLAILEDTISPARLPDLFAGVPLVVAGRYRGPASGSMSLAGTAADGQGWSEAVAGQHREATAITAQWARAHLRDLEDRYVCAPDRVASDELEKRIVDTSLRFGVLCRFTAYVAVDSRVVAEGGTRHRVLQPVEAPSGWDMFATPSVIAAPSAMAPVRAAMPPPPARREKHSARSRLSRVQGLPELLEDTGAVPIADADALSAAREQVRDEARRMREAGRLTDDERREWLAELADRIDALLRHLSSQGVPRSAYSALSALQMQLREFHDPGNAFWDYVLHALDDFADDAGSPKRRRPFWKRS